MDLRCCLCAAVTDANGPFMRDIAPPFYVCDLGAPRARLEAKASARVILRRDLPRKLGTLPESPLEYTLSRKRIAQAVATSSNNGASDG